MEIKIGNNTKVPSIFNIKATPKVTPNDACRRMLEKTHTKTPRDTIMPLKKSAFPEVSSDTFRTRDMLFCIRPS